LQAIITVYASIETLSRNLKARENQKREGLSVKLLERLTGINRASTQKV